MITDNQTNKLFLADTLQTKHPVFYQSFEKILNECGVKPNILKGTKDIWAVDYMPIQVSQNKFIQFVYNPDYLQTIAYRKTISDVDSICRSIGLAPQKSNIVLDGGNVIRSSDKVVMTDKVFKENPTIPEKKLIRELEELFEVERIIFVPADKNDFTGHADGMVRFLDDRTVLINAYSPIEEKPAFTTAFRLSLNNAGLDYIEVPYNPYMNRNKDQAYGTYLNFLHMENIVIVPTFGMEEDNEVVKLYEVLFQGYQIKTIESKEIADKGGILNCITWNIVE